MLPYPRAARPTLLRNSPQTQLADGLLPIPGDRDQLQ